MRQLLYSDLDTEFTLMPHASNDHTADSAPRELTMSETLRILDVAVELRRQQDTALAQLNREAVRRRLREKLVATAELTGEEVTEQEIEAAIDHYFDNEHTFAEPPMSFELWLAHLYIRRGRVAGVACAIAAAAGLLFGLLSWWSRT